MVLNKNTSHLGFAYIFLRKKRHTHFIHMNFFINRIFYQVLKEMSNGLVEIQYKRNHFQLISHVSHVTSLTWQDVIFFRDNVNFIHHSLKIQFNKSFQRFFLIMCVYFYFNLHNFNFDSFANLMNCLSGKKINVLQF